MYVSTRREIEMQGSDISRYQDSVFVTVMVSTRLELTRMVIFGRPSLEAQLRVVSEKNRQYF